MSGYALTEAADRDLSDIVTHSIATWGVERAERYFADMHAMFEHLAAFPDLGQDAGHPRDGYRQFVHDSHRVFYRRIEDGILVVRVLHRRQQPEGNL